MELLISPEQPLAPPKVSVAYDVFVLDASIYDGSILPNALISFRDTSPYIVGERVFMQTHLLYIVYVSSELGELIPGGQVF